MGNTWLIIVPFLIIWGRLYAHVKENNIEAGTGMRAIDTKGSWAPHENVEDKVYVVYCYMYTHC